MYTFVQCMLRARATEMIPKWANPKAQALKTHNLQHILHERETEQKITITKLKIHIQNYTNGVPKRKIRIFFFFAFALCCRIPAVVFVFFFNINIYSIIAALQ